MYIQIYITPKKKRDTSPFPDSRYVCIAEQPSANLRKKSGIYYIANKITGDIYVGSAVDFYRRWHGHKSKLRTQKHHSIHLQRAWNKYGESNFVFIVIKDVADKSKLIEEEQRCLDMMSPDYNISPTAGNCLGVKHGENFSKIMSIVTSKEKNGFWKKNHTDETKELMSENHVDVSGEKNPMYGVQLNGEINPMFGRERNDTAEFNRRTKKGKTYEEMYGEERAKELRDKQRQRKLPIKQVIQKDLSGEIMEIHRSAQAAAKKINIGTIPSSSKKIRNCCLGKSKQALGFMWEYQ